MDGVISYMNTALDLFSAEDLTKRAAAFEAGGLVLLHVRRDSDDRWFACFECDQDHTEPESAIAAMLAMIESLQPPLLTVWQNCSVREFNIGHDCGQEPCAYNQGLSTALSQPALPCEQPSTSSAPSRRGWGNRTNHA